MVTFRTEMMGTIYVTDNIDFVRTIPDGTVKIISLDEDRNLDPNDPNVIIGTCLLPPVEALIAENDGDEDLYDIHYMAYLNTPAVQQFITAIIGALFRQKSLLLYAPQLNDTNSIKKLMKFMWDLYGIGIGIVGSDVNKCCYDSRCIPIWLNMMYMDNIIDPSEFLYFYPDHVTINNMVMNKLIADIKPVCNSYEDRVYAIKNLQKKIKEKPETIQPIYDTRYTDALLWE